MSVPKSQQKADGTDAVSLMELLIHKDNEVKKVLQLGQLWSIYSSYHPTFDDCVISQATVLSLIPGQGTLKPCE